MATRTRTRCKFPWPPTPRLHSPRRVLRGLRSRASISVLAVRRPVAATRLCATRSAAVALASQLRPRRSADHRGRPADVELAGRYVTRMATRTRTRCKFPWPPTPRLHSPRRVLRGLRSRASISVLAVRRPVAATRLCATRSAAVALASQLRPRRSAGRHGRPADVGLAGRCATPMATRIRTRCKFPWPPTPRLHSPRQALRGL